MKNVTEKSDLIICLHLKHLPILILIFGLVFVSCQPETNPPVDSGGKLVLGFTHRVDDVELQTDSIIYVNEAGNHYGINEVKYFISDVLLYNRTGEYFPINEEKVIHYVDIDLPETLHWNVFDPIPEGIYDSLVFTFGLNAERNQSFTFVNPPEVNMFWPDVLGGGYHYLMINGKWINHGQKITPFDFHIGIGQLYSGITASVDSITGFVHNYFTVSLALEGIEIKDKTKTSIEITMNIASWFKSPHTWDFDFWGGYIMQNQEAMRTASENGQDAFSVSSIKRGYVD